LLIFTKSGEKQQRKPTSSSRTPGEPQQRYAQRARLPTRSQALYQAPPRARLNFIINLSFNHKGWGKTTTKTNAVVPGAEREPAANRAMGVVPIVPANVAPSAPTKL